MLFHVTMFNRTFGVASSEMLIVLINYEFNFIDHGGNNSKQNIDIFMRIVALSVVIQNQDKKSYLW